MSLGKVFVLFTFLLIRTNAIMYIDLSWQKYGKVILSKILMNNMLGLA